jgi:Coenzyme PQQ synthesis protein D (PqqD)
VDVAVSNLDWADWGLPYPLKTGPMTAANAYLRSSAVVSRMIAGETLVVPVRGKVGDLASIYSFNDVGTTIWEALAKPTPMDTLVDLIERDYEVGRERAAQDVENFLEEMRTAELVTTVEVRGTDVMDRTELRETA